MKTCLLLSGLPRHIFASESNIRHHLIEPNDADVFIHTWSDDQKVCNDLEKMYCPKAMICEKQRLFSNPNWDLSRMLSFYARSYTHDSFMTMLYSSWYSVLQANLLKEQYALHNNLNYDCVIRARFDIIYDQQIKCSQYDLSKIHISHRTDLPSEMINDQFAFSSNDIMNIYSSGFLLLDSVQSKKHKTDGIFCGETLVYEILKRFNIDCNILTDLKTRTLGK